MSGVSEPDTVILTRQPGQSLTVYTRIVGTKSRIMTMAGKLLVGKWPGGISFGVSKLLVGKGPGGMNCR